MNVHQQTEFDFVPPGSPEGLTQWQSTRREATKLLSERLGLPLCREVEVRLQDGVVLRGRLRLREELLFVEQSDARNVELAIGRASFRHSDIEACVRLD